MSPQPLLQYDVAYPEELNRWMVLIKWLLIIPNLIVLMVLYLALSITTIVAFFGILFTGNYPEGLFKFAVSTMRWSANASAYMYLQRDEYPPFSGTASYPVTFDLARPESLSRWKIFLKWLFVIPHLIVLYLLDIALSVVELLAFFAILFTKKYPRSLFDFTVGVFRWTYRVYAYMWLLTDAYPPFSMAANPEGSSPSFSMGTV